MLVRIVEQLQSRCHIHRWEYTFNPNRILKRGVFEKFVQERKVKVIMSNLHQFRDNYCRETSWGMANDFLVDKMRFFSCNSVFDVHLLTVLTFSKQSTKNNSLTIPINSGHNFPHQRFFGLNSVVVCLVSVANSENTTTKVLWVPPKQLLTWHSLEHVNGSHLPTTVSCRGTHFADSFWSVASRGRLAQASLSLLRKVTFSWSYILLTHVIPFRSFFWKTIHLHNSNLR